MSSWLSLSLERSDRDDVLYSDGRPLRANRESVVASSSTSPADIKDYCPTRMT